jgi:hypothetical protein
LSQLKDNARRMTIETVLDENREHLGVLNVFYRDIAPINAAGTSGSRHLFGNH